MTKFIPSLVHVGWSKWGCRRSTTQKVKETSIEYFYWMLQYIYTVCVNQNNVIPYLYFTREELKQLSSVLREPWSFKSSESLLLEDLSRKCVNERTLSTHIFFEDLAEVLIVSSFPFIFFLVYRLSKV